MFTTYFLPILISMLSCGIPALTGIVRFRLIPPKYHPFIFFIWLGFFNELLTIILINTIRNNAVNGNPYVLCEFLLILWQFRNWGIFRKREIVYRLCLFLLPLIWVLDTLVFHSITQFSSVYRSCYSFAIVLFSIHYINEIFFTERRNILKNAGFVISLTFLIYFSFKGVLEFYYLFRIQSMKSFYKYLLHTMGIINIASNIAYAFAILWIPKKDIYTLPY